MGNHHLNLLSRTIGLPPSHMANHKRRSTNNIRRLLLSKIYQTRLLQRMDGPNKNNSRSARLHLSDHLCLAPAGTRRSANNLGDTYFPPNRLHNPTGNLFCPGKKTKQVKNNRTAGNTLYGNHRALCLSKPKYRPGNNGAGISAVCHLLHLEIL